MKTEKFTISRNRMILGILMGVFNAILFYLVFFLLEQSFTAFIAPTLYAIAKPSIYENFSVWVLAFLSVLYGQSVAFRFFFNRPERRYSSRKRLTDVFVDTQVLIWVSLYLVIRLYALLQISLQGLEDLLWPEIGICMVFLAVVLFLQPWLSLRRYQLINTRKWFLHSLWSIPLMAIGLISFTPDQFYLEDKLKQDLEPQFKYEIQLPYSEFSSKVEKRSQTTDVYIVEDNSNSFAEVEGKRLDPDKVFNFLCDYVPSKVRPDAVKYHLILLNAKGSSNMKIIMDILDSSAKDSLCYFQFALRSVYNPIPNFSQKSWMCLYLPQHVSVMQKLPVPIQPEFTVGELQLKYDTTTKSIITHNSNSILQNLRDSFALNRALPNLLLEESNLNTLTLQQYAKFYGELKETIEILRFDYCLENYGKGYSKLDFKTKMEVDDALNYKFLYK